MHRGSGATIAGPGAGDLARAGEEASGSCAPVETLRERRWRLAMANAKLASFAVDFTAGLISSDAGDLPVCAHSFEDLLGWAGPEYRDACRAAWARHLETGETASVEIILTRADGQSGWNELMFEAVRDADGQVVGLVGARQDISRRKAIELELIEQSRRAEAANRAKSEFLANMSHEIRTPLNGVLTMAQVLSQDAMTPRQRDQLSVIRQSGQDLLLLLNDILDFSKIEAGKLELEDVEFDPEAVLESTLAAFAAQAEKKDLQLWLDVAPDARGLRRGDPSRLRQIVANFVANALKFTEEGGVRIAIAGRGPDGREGLRVSVKDSGVGIPAGKMALLFQKFSQVDASTTRRFGGTGLGLAICQELAGLMGGRVWAESVEGLGSTFYASLKLPWVREAGLAPAETPEAGEIDVDAPDRPLRVLAAEDNPTNRLVLSTVMEVFGIALTLAGDGQEAVSAWRAGGFDAILMDVQMPVMDGVQATRAIRAEETARGLARTPIVAVSANAFHHQISEYLAAGMDTHVCKPIELGALKAALDHVLAPPVLARAG